MTDFQRGRTAGLDEAARLAYGTACGKCEHPSCQLRRDIATELYELVGRGSKVEADECRAQDPMRAMVREEIRAALAPLIEPSPVREGTLGGVWRDYALGKLTTREMAQKTIAADCVDDARALRSYRHGYLHIVDDPTQEAAAMSQARKERA